MNWTNLAIIYVILCVSFNTITDIKYTELSSVTYKKIEYNKMLDSAIDDGIYNLVERDSNNNLQLNKDVAVNQFYNSLFANFGILNNEFESILLSNYVPIILVTDIDGYYINYHDYYERDGEKAVNNIWTEKLPYYYEDEEYIYKFTLGTYVYVINKSSNEMLEGHYEDIKESISNSKQDFDEVRRNSIINSITKTMNYYINNHNSIAEQFGITYEFWLPQIEQADWSRTIDDISMLVIFQGYPFGISDYTYNRYSLAGARIKKSKSFYISEIDGIKYYHKEDCNKLSSKEIMYYTKEECALQGAFPCPECFY